MQEEMLSLSLSYPYPSAKVGQAASNIKEMSAKITRKFLETIHLMPVLVPVP
jgi:hypothetical protein